MPATQEGVARFWRRQFYVTAGLVLILDQWTKSAIRHSFSEGLPRTVIPGILSLTHVHNTGAAFGIMPAGTVFFSAVSLVVCVALVLWGKSLLSQGPWLRIALSLELGGALGNLIDRLVRGHVTDFLDLDTTIRFLREYPVFNVADIALTTGAICIAVHLLIDTRKH
ncbi:MAG: signal peptidase II [Armatimonadetes bacterium]|nr:signal peptidase II [Armatimonadota bacterium]